MAGMAKIRMGSIIRAMLWAALVLIPSLLALHCFIHRDRIFPYTDTVIVYGRETCGITRMVRAGLSAQGIPYTFANIDVQAIDDELWHKLGPRFKETRITLPIVHVAGEMLLTPTAQQVQEARARSPSPSTRDYRTFLKGADPVPHY